MKMNYPQNTKIRYLFEKIKNTKGLINLLNTNKNLIYKCTEILSCNQFSHLHKCVMRTKEYPIFK